ncbi:DUF1178 family protein [Mesorhizobium xinjiangense]|uniref:DUF1178 family protein n=1 Tax=Mesorhizobium xinjiangense TaxID=2678685 RepID=UPI0012EDA8C2|nr:DUF1178 family protein [Mesorhizobium xinjiangense]
MIRFALHCEKGHEFEAWFRNNDDYDTQAKRGLVGCPNCGSVKVGKALMAPSVASSKKKEQVALAGNQEQRRIVAQLKEMTEKLRASADYVGDKFAEEARRIHYGETEARGIYGEATVDEAKGLMEDGVEFIPLPNIPDDHN